MKVEGEKIELDVTHIKHACAFGSCIQPSICEKSPQCIWRDRDEG